MTSASWGRERLSINAEKSGQGEGAGLAVSGHFFQCGLLSEKGLKVILSSSFFGKD